MPALTTDRDNAANGVGSEPHRPTVDLSTDQLHCIHRILDRVIPHGQVRVFGSRATGRARPFSDLDLLLTQPTRLSWLQRAELRELFEASDLPFRVDVVEAEGLPPAMAARAASESAALPSAQPAAPATSG